MAFFPQKGGGLPFLNLKNFNPGKKVCLNFKKTFFFIFFFKKPEFFSNLFFSTGKELA